MSKLHGLKKSKSRRNAEDSTEKRLDFKCYEDDLLIFNLEQSTETSVSLKVKIVW